MRWVESFLQRISGKVVWDGGMYKQSWAEKKGPCQKKWKGKIPAPAYGLSIFWEIHVIGVVHYSKIKNLQNNVHFIIRINEPHHGLVNGFGGDENQGVIVVHV